MSLKLSLRPHERIIISGAVLQNVGSPSVITIENNVPVLRQKNIMNEADAVSPCRRIYFVIQLMYVDGQDQEKYNKIYWDLVRDLVEAAPSLLRIIDQISEHIFKTEYYQALKLARELINYEEEAIGCVQECVGNLSGS
ncbi:putative flagellum biosynthesis repressor protein FlbT 1 [uncultured Desulfobacterium sp.]|uniref:Putative flagellum biosynthesis repressor protein FlbT 1 n=1 Tax=uncultured Desulfobacterium sp. TaxID=201089 RepID=A0A445MZE8_9BACT|nr:putative flagellum biosynthesis repressor protein FlbT 1 [uncultured Desulfobacterium sp.]